MSKQSLLLVDGDTRSLRVLEVSLRKAGFTVTTAETVSDALEKLALHAPDLIVSETVFADGDGFELRRRVRGMPERVDIPFIFLTAEQAIENKIRGLELGVDDYLTKPIYIKEIITRVNILLQKRQRTSFEERRDGRTRFAGRVSDMPVVDVIQTIEMSRKSGVIQFVGDRSNQATIYFRDGKVIDAEAGTLQGEDAVYRLLTWNDGEFEVVFRTVRRREVITTSSQGMLMEGMRRLDEWSRLLEQLPPMNHRFEVDASELVSRLGEVPDDNNRILRMLDGKRTLIEVIDSSDVGDLECLQAISRLYFEELLVDLDQGPARRRDSKPQLAVEAVVQTPMEEVASGPSATAPEPVSDEMIQETGPLMGGYRPSSLRLIDEAVAAAQAIDSSLFADDPEPDHDSIPHTIEADEPELEEVEEIEEDPVGRRDDSGLRMIGSHGRDRAEASGELSLMRGTALPVSETQREMVTILPRRITREVQIMPAVEPESEQAAAPPPAHVPPVEAARPPALPRMASGTSIDRRSNGPGAGAIALLALAAVLTGVAVYLRLHRSHLHAKQIDAGAEHAAIPPGDAEVVAIPAIDARTVAERIDAQRAVAAVQVDAASVARPDAAVDAGIDAGIDARRDAGIDARPADAGIDARPIDAGTDARVADAATATVPSATDAGVIDAGQTPTQRAKELTAAAQVAIADSQLEKALELVDRSIKIKHTESAFLVRATVLQRLDRIQDAVDSVDSAIDIAKQRGSELPAAWKQRGLILWSARHKDEARISLAHYLELSPNGKDADDVRKLLETP